MRKPCTLPLSLLLFAILALAVSAVSGQAGAPSSIQIFMPGGGLPNRSIRFTLTRDDGRVETVFTDTKGRFPITGDLVRDADYTVTVEGDGRTFATTVATFRTFRNQVIYVPVFLQPPESGKRVRPSVLDVSDAGVPAEARADYQRAMQNLAKGETEKAIEGLQHAITSHPKYLRALNDLGVIYLQQKRFDEAGNAFEAAIKIDPGFVYSRLNLGVVRNRQGKQAEAIAIFAKLHQENPQFMPVLIPYSEALTEAGKFAEAEKIVRRVFENPDLDAATRGEAHFRLGAIFNRQNRFAEAAQELGKAVALAPNTVMAHLQLGGALIQLNRLAEAERELLKAYELGGSAAGAAQFLLGQVYYLQQKYELARQAFERYLKDVPDAPNAAQVKEVIQKISDALKKP